MIINFGSINIDHVYRVDHMPVAGETLAVKSYAKFLGGKGANQSIAIAKSGGTVRHVGAVGPDGAWAVEALRQAGIDPTHVLEVEAPTGHAIITVDDAGENQILICGGANRCLTMDQIAGELGNSAAHGDWVLLQNETNLAPEIVREAKARGYKIAYSAAPFVAGDALPLVGNIDLLAVNQIEAEALARASGTSIADLPCPNVLVTKGRAGAAFHAGGSVHAQSAFEAVPIDTTGAGDTFLGAFLARYTQAGDVQSALRFAAAASAIQITRPGAADAIPDEKDVVEFLNQQEA